MYGDIRTVRKRTVVGSLLCTDASRHAVGTTADAGSRCSQQPNAQPACQRLVSCDATPGSVDSTTTARVGYGAASEQPRAGQRAAQSGAGRAGQWNRSAAAAGQCVSSLEIWSTPYASGVIPQCDATCGSTPAEFRSDGKQTCTRSVAHSSTAGSRVEHSISGSDP